jgi:hypothetical protein|tara:strand:- start:77 stop:799 length:723 start_codon:yes stop_codon:yes gene_type:complete
MKKLFTIALVILMLIPSKAKSQNNEGAAAAAAGLLAIGAGIAAIEQLKEQLEQKAVEEVLTAYPSLVNFELKTGSLKGTKMKDLSSVGIVTFEIKDLDSSEKFVLFAFLSNGWSNQFGVDYSKLKWKLFSRNEWNKLMQAYIKTASKIEISIDDVASSKIVNKGVQQNKKFIIEFSKIKGDVYYTSDYSDEFKIVFNERSLGLYLKESNPDEFRRGGPRGDLVQIRRKSIIKAHSFLNSN